MDGSTLFLSLALIVLAYFSGSLLGAIWVCRWLNEPDPMLYGSHNPGATNVYRLAGFKAAFLTLAWDAAKAALPVWLGVQAELPRETLWAIALAAIVGHVLPVFHHFRGGKGVASTLGAGLVLAPVTTLWLTLIWFAMLFWKRISALASLTAAFFAPWLALWFDPDQFPLFAILALFILVRHRENLVRLANREEAPIL